MDPQEKCISTADARIRPPAITPTSLLQLSRASGLLEDGGGEISSMASSVDRSASRSGPRWSVYVAEDCWATSSLLLQSPRSKELQFLRWRPALLSWLKVKEEASWCAGGG